MKGSAPVMLILGLLWSLAGAVVVVYPLVKGRMRSGTETVDRTDDPQRFWAAYGASTGLFLIVSLALALFLRALVR